VISEALEAAEATGEADMAATYRQVASEVTTEVLAAALSESSEKAAPPVVMEVLAAALGESPEKVAAPPAAMDVETETVHNSAPARSVMETPTFVMEEEPEYKAPPPVKVRKVPVAPPIIKARVKEPSLCEAMAVCFGGK
jgi:2-hydroxychromene-2-carboxylate isomerase